MKLYNKETKYTNQGEFDSDIKVFNQDLNFLNLCDVTKDYQNNVVISNLNECYLKLENFYLTEENYLNKFGSLTLIVDINTFDDLVEEYIGKYDSRFSSIEDISYTDYLKGNLRIEMNSKKFKQADKEIMNIINNYPNYNIQYTNHALENYDVYLTFLAVKILFYTIILFIAFISFLSMATTINTSLELRKNEFAILRSIGLNRKGVSKMLYLEGFFLIFKTLYYGITISLVFTYVLLWVSKLSSTKIIKKYPSPIIYILIAILGVIIVIASIMYYNNRKIKKQNIIETIRNENI